MNRNKHTLDVEQFTTALRAVADGWQQLDSALDIIRQATGRDIALPVDPESFRAGVECTVADLEAATRGAAA